MQVENVSPVSLHRKEEASPELKTKSGKEMTRHAMEVNAEREEQLYSDLDHIHVLCSRYTCFG